MERCETCTKKCPQMELADECAKGRMYATNELIECQKELQALKDKQEQGLLIELPRIGGTVYLRACCECVCISEERETGLKECPFENDCDFDECEDGNERMFKTFVTNIWNDGHGWYFIVRGLDIEIPVSDIGRTVFFTEEALAKMGE